MPFRQLSFEEVREVALAADKPPLQPISKVLIQQTRDDQVVTCCPTCKHIERIYRRTLRPCFLPALRAIIELGPMTTTQLFEHFSDRPGLAAAIARHFGEVRHWRFATQ